MVPRDLVHRASAAATQDAAWAEALTFRVTCRQHGQPRPLGDCAQPGPGAQLRTPAEVKSCPSLGPAGHWWGCGSGHSRLFFFPLRIRQGPNSKQTALKAGKWKQVS